MMRPLLPLFIPAILLLAMACSTSEPVQTPREEVAEPRQEQVVERESESLKEEESQMMARLEARRSHLRDQFVGLSHDMPAFYDRVSELQQDPTQGFRVQIFSTRDVALADTTRREYERWLEESRLDARPHSYIDYRQPTYRVRVGDFQSRERAIIFSRVLKRQFPGAWVVYSAVEPDRVPADSVRFEPIRD